MYSRGLLLGIVFVPTVGAFLLPFLRLVSARLRNGVSLLLVAFALVGSLLLVPKVMSGQPVDVSYPLPLGFNFVLHADGLAVFMAIVSSLVSSIIVLYSYGLHQPLRQPERVLPDGGAVPGSDDGAGLRRQPHPSVSCSGRSPAIASWRLIGFFREQQHVVRADKAFLVTVFGALAMLLGFVMIGHDAGSFDLAAIKAQPGRPAAADAGGGADPDGHSLQVGDAALPHVAAGRRRGALAR